MLSNYHSNHLINSGIKTLARNLEILKGTIEGQTIQWTKVRGQKKIYKDLHLKIESHEPNSKEKQERKKK